MENFFAIFPRYGKRALDFGAVHLASPLCCGYGIAMNRFTFVVLGTFLSFSAALAQPPPPALGSFPGPSGTLFRVWAPFAESAAVAGEFNQWVPEPMTPAADHGT